MTAKVTTDQIRDLREATGSGIIDVKKALEDSGGDEKKALLILREKGIAKSKARSDKETKEGMIGSYVHTNQKIGVLVEVRAETDFVARNEDFQEFVKHLAQHIAASAPVVVRMEDVPEKILSEEKAIIEKQIAKEKKPEKVKEQIINGKLEAVRKEHALLGQPHVRDPKKTVGDALNDLIGKIGEQIEIVRFVRYELGQD